MTARSFRQTQVAATLGTIQACAASALAPTPQARLCTEGGVSGTTPLSVTVRNQRASVMFEIAPGQASWSAGDWDVPISIDTPNSNVTIKAAYICRRTSGGTAVATVGSGTSFSTVISSSQVYTLTVSGSLSTGSATDVAYIVIEATTPGTIQAFTFTPNQLITTPIRSALTSSGAATLAPTEADAVGSPVMRGVGAGTLAPAFATGAGGAAAAPRGTILHPSHKKVYILT